MPLEGAKFYGPKTGNGSETASYYVEVLPGEPSDVTKDGIRYKLDHKDTSPGTGYSVTKEDQYPLTGYTFNENVSTKIRSKYNNAKFYYTRNSYKIKFINKGKEDKSVEKKYEQSISSENYTPVRPGSLPDYYEFDGWYDNELCEGEAFDFNGKKMPAQNVTLYAKWTAKKINLTYNLNNPEGDVVKGTKKVEAGTIANTVLPSATTTSDYSFAGWYYADGNGNITSDAYNTNEAITKDTSVIGKWLYNGELKVVYDPGTEGTNAKVPTDSNIYAGGAKVTVAKNATTTSKKKFLGWQLNGNLYQPGASFEINKDLATEDVVTLTAIWGSEEASTTLTYNPGNGRGTAKKAAVLNNVAVTIESHGTLGFLAPEEAGKEYYFAGWATSLADATAGNATYSDGQTIRVDVNGENVLYATWIEKTVITLVANSSVDKYDGTKKEVNDFQPLTNSKYTVEGLTAHAEGTDAGVYETEITGIPIVKLDDNVVTDRVVVKTQKGQLTISKRDVTLTSATDSKPYDGTALTKPKVTVGGDGFVDGEVSDIKATGTVTNVSDGEVTNTITFKPEANYKADNYTIAKNEGKLSIIANDTEVTVTIKGNTATATYDGNSHSVEGYTVENISKPTLYQENNIKFTGNAKAEGIAAGEYPMNLTSAQFSNASANFTDVKFVVTDGSLTIAPKSIVPDGPDTPDEKKTGITVTNPADSKYDGEEHKNKPTVTDTKTDVTLVENKDYTLVYSDNVTDAGEVTVTIIGANNYTGRFNVTYQITQRSVTLTSGSASKVYDKLPLTKDEVTVSGDGFAKEEGATYKVTGSQTEKGSSKNTFTFELKSNTKASNYSIEVKFGELKVTAEDGEVVVTITGHKDTFEYDGNEKSVDGYDVSITQGSTYTTDDFTFNGNAEVKKTAAGTYPMGLQAEDFSNNNANYSTVTFIVNDGYLTINPKSINPEDEKTGIKVTKPNDTMYNGEEQKNKPTVTDSKTGKTLTEGKDYTLSYSKDVTNAGKVEVTITGIGNYEGTANTSYQITKRNVTLTSGTASKVYDKTPLAKNEVTVSGDGFVKQEGATYNVTGSQTEVGSSKNTFTYELKSNTIASNYNIKKVEGDLIVTFQDGEVVVTITGHAKTVDYDGNEKTVTGYDVSITEGSKYTTSDFTFKGNAEAKGTAAGTYQMNLSSTQFSNTNTN